ncbi:hypothetical protein HU675_0038630 [Bradyrhizobium septentrionale]|uniref:hypothetical protein n=1 Tax=Bradyrhizobium septentrionale TaxID=1404411 RepID=UPI00159687E9|nr:hypothetical protein [Bradyrhizobium septentrionale]UGY23803.1 hypothetical protein HU675_0038630 [Bradyrhizobium septentrionale]
MKLSKAIEQLQAIQARFGDLDIVGGFLQDDTPLGNICVVNSEGMEIFVNRRLTGPPYRPAETQRSSPKTRTASVRLTSKACF